MLAAVLEARGALPGEVRRLVHMASLPMDDIEQNAAIVNAVQRTLAWSFRRVSPRASG